MSRPALPEGDLLLHSLMLFGRDGEPTEALAEELQLPGRAVHSAEELQHPRPRLPPLAEEVLRHGEGGEGDAAQEAVLVAQHGTNKDCTSIGQCEVQAAEAAIEAGDGVQDDVAGGAALVGGLHGHLPVVADHLPWPHLRGHPGGLLEDDEDPQQPVRVQQGREGLHRAEEDQGDGDGGPAAGLHEHGQLDMGMDRRVCPYSIAVIMCIPFAAPHHIYCMLQFGQRYCDECGKDFRKIYLS